MHLCWGDKLWHGNKAAWKLVMHLQTASPRPSAAQQAAAAGRLPGCRGASPPLPPQGLQQGWQELHPAIELPCHRCQAGAQRARAAGHRCRPARTLCHLQPPTRRASPALRAQGLPPGFPHVSYPSPALGTPQPRSALRTLLAARMHGTRECLPCQQARRRLPGRIARAAMPSAGARAAWQPLQTAVLPCPGSGLGS